MNASIPHLKGKWLWCWKREPFQVLLPLLRHVMPFNDRNCCFTMLSKEAVLVTGYFIPSILACLNVKSILLQPSIFRMNLLIKLKVIMLVLTPIICRISLKQCHWLAWRVRWWWQARLSYTWNYLIIKSVIWLSLLIWKNWCHFLAKSTKSYFST